MAIYHDTRCALCGQYVAASDREAMLEATRWEWSETLVDEALVDRHLCVDQDPHGARQWARLADAGEMVPELRWLIEAALERRQAAPLAGWATFTGPGASSATVARYVIATTGRRPASGSARDTEGRARVRLPASGMGRSPP